MHRKAIKLAKNNKMHHLCFEKKGKGLEQLLKDNFSSIMHWLKTIKCIDFLLTKRAKANHIYSKLNKSVEALQLYAGKLHISIHIMASPGLSSSLSLQAFWILLKTGYYSNNLFFFFSWAGYSNKSLFSFRALSPNELYSATTPHDSGQKTVQYEYQNLWKPPLAFKYSRMEVG